MTLAARIVNVRYTVGLHMRSIQTLLKNLEPVLLYVYIWQIPFSWRFIFQSSRSQINPGFNEYMDISLYIGEIILFIALIIHIINNISIKKSIIRYILEYIHGIHEILLFHVERATLSFILVVFLFINVLNSIDILLSSAALIHLGFFVLLLFLIQKEYVSRGTLFLNNIFIIFLISLIIQLIISFGQFISGSSLELFFINESILSLQMSNVAKSHIFTYEFLRGYGTFPHPNLLAAYALFVLIYAYSFRDTLFHVKHRIYFLILVATFTILLTQSKLSIILLLFMAYFVFSKRSGMFHVKHVILVLFLIIIASSTYGIFHKDLLVTTSTRIHQAKMQIQQYTPTIFGTGIGTYRLSYDALQENWWNMEPIHFVPYIVLSELGIGIVAFFVYGFYRFIKNVSRGTFKSIDLTLIFLVYILSIDHYAWDIYQGTCILVLTIWIVFVSIDKRYIILYHDK